VSVFESTLQVRAGPTKAAQSILLIALAAFVYWLWSSGLAVQILTYKSDITYLAIQHFQLVATAGVLAVGVAVPMGILLSRPRFRSVANIVMQAFNVGSTIPMLAVLALSMTVLGIGARPAIFGLWICALLPIVHNTYAGLKSVPPHLIDAAKGMGMTPLQMLFHTELPNALYVIFSGIRTAMATCIGAAPLAFLIGAGGLGELIFTGIDLDELPMMLAGAIPTALLAVAVDFLLGAAQYYLIPRGINPLRY
jgi:osmoprotectant transport system permease protein